MHNQCIFYSMNQVDLVLKSSGAYTALQSEKAVSALFTSKQILPFGCVFLAFHGSIYTTYLTSDLQMVDIPQLKADAASPQAQGWCTAVPTFKTLAQQCANLQPMCPGSSSHTIYVSQSTGCPRDTLLFIEL